MKLKLVKIIQSKVMSPKEPLSVYEPAINSPKSVIYSKDGSKFYVNSLEGYVTIVFDSKSLKKLKEIRHEFKASNNKLFKDNENSVFDVGHRCIFLSRKTCSVSSTKRYVGKCLKCDSHKMLLTSVAAADSCVSTKTIFL